MQVSGKALGRLALRLAGRTREAAAIDMEAVRILDALLPAAVLGQRDDAAGRRCTAWFGVCLDALSLTAAGRALIAYALVPATRRAWATHQAPDALDRFHAVVTQLLALGDAPPAAAADDQADAPPAAAPADEPWLLELQVLLYAEVAAAADATASDATCVDARPYMAALLQLAARLAALVQAQETARRAAAHARHTEGLLEELQGAQDMAAVLAAVQSCAEALVAHLAAPDAHESDGADGAGPSESEADEAGPSSGGVGPAPDGSDGVRATLGTPPHSKHTTLASCKCNRVTLVRA